MKTIETIKANILKDKTFNKNIDSLRYYDVDQFISDSKTYIKAIKEGRMFCNIASISNSGMSRTISFKSCQKSDKRYYYRNYTCLFICLDYKETNNNNGYFRIGGCGMDMIFHTNYSIMHDFKRYGIISDKECRSLCQMTPTVI